jgi:hypothetical protein
MRCSEPRRWIAASAALAAAALAVSAGPAPLAGPRAGGAKPVGKATVLAADVRVAGRLVLASAKLFAGARVTTSRRGHVLLEFVLKRATCRASGTSRLRVRPAARVLLYVDAGTPYCVTYGRGGLKVRTRSAVIDADDPVFAVAVSGSRTVVTVKRGRVVVSGRAGRPRAVVVGTRQQVVVPVGEAPGRPAAMPPLPAAARQTFAVLERTLPAPADTTPPATSVTAAPPAATASTSAALSFRASETGVTLACALDGGVFRLCASPVRYTGLAEGPHSFSVRGTDGAGNTGAPAVVTWRVDRTPPETEIEGAPPDPSAERVAELVFRASEDGATFACSLDRSAFEPCTSPRTYADLVDGPHAFSVLATDAAGNTGPPVSHTWVVDTTAPATVITERSLAATTASFAFAAEETGVTFACALDERAFEPCASPMTYRGLPAGPHLFRVRATDAAGNTGQSASHAWTATGAQPDLVIAGLAGTSVTVRNAGDGAAGPFVVTVGASRVLEFAGLAAGATETRSWTPCAEGTITATADPSNAVVESNEQNNSASITSVC